MKVIYSGEHEASGLLIQEGIGDSDHSSLLPLEGQVMQEHLPMVVKPIPRLVCLAMGLGLPTMLSMFTSIAGEVIAQGFLASIPNRNPTGSAFAAGALISAAKLFQVAASSLSFGLYPLIGGLQGELTQRMGSENRPSAEEGEAIRLRLYRWIHQGFICDLIGMTVVGIFFAFSGEIFNRIFSQPLYDSMLAQRFLRCYLPGLPAFFYCSSMGTSFNALGFGKYVVPFSICSLILSTLIMNAFTHGKWGAPSLGITGVAIGMASRNWMNAIFYALLSFKSSDNFLLQNFYRVHKFSCQNNRAAMKTFLKFGTATALRLGVDFSMNYVCIIFFGLLGSAALSIGNVASQVLSITCLPGISLGMAASKLVKEHLDAGRPKDAIRQGNVIISMNFIVAALFLLSGYLASEKIASWFLSDLNQIKEAGKLLTLMLMMQLFDGVRTAVVNSLSGLSDLKIPTAISVISQVIIGLPLAYVLSEKTKLGLYGIPTGVIIGITNAAILILSRWGCKKTSSHILPGENSPRLSQRNNHTQAAFHYYSQDQEPIAGGEIIENKT